MFPHQKLRFFNFCLASWEIIPTGFKKLPEGLETIPEASSPNPENFQKNLIFCIFLTFCGLCKNLSSNGNFSQEIEMYQRMHFWTGLDPGLVRKLLRAQMNSQIERYVHFSDRNTRFFDTPC